ncbi:HAMP domain-containing sensor histidine kinase [Ferrovibrio sp.]|uniref:sensor histidine kinase n=1 Tax=Ferrovibrio sp. TaxID=1917215 RepID=UPI001B7C7820|nr:PAS domain-containing sensor histidine kinase [Ferrovibrio sp.]MBP7062676.1 PAS domain-containing sensor histidine kinase [Ferrovibrio sp.]
MDSYLPLGQVIANVAAPLIVALLCLYAHHRRIGGADLLLWAWAHLALAATFLFAHQAPGSSPTDPAAEWLAAIFFNSTSSWLLLFGVLAMEYPKVTLWRALPAALVFASLTLTLNLIDPEVYLRWGLLLNPSVNLAAGLLLLRRWYSAVYVLAGLVLVLRSANGFLFSYALRETGILSLPMHTITLSIFFNFLAGLSLLAIAVENAWQQLGQALAEARDARQEADAILDLAPASILRKDRDLRVIRGNRFAWDLAQRFQTNSLDPSGSATGLRSRDVMPATAAAAMEQMDRRLISQPDISPLECEIVVPLGDGTEATLLVRKTAITDANGQGDGTMTVALDITHLKQVETRLRQQIAVAEQANKAKSDFLANMSHELRTPLNGIQGFADMLAAGYMGELNPRQQDYVGNIQNSARHMLALVSKLLDLSSLDAGRPELHFASADLGEIIAAAATAAQPLASKRGLTLEWHSRPATIQCDDAALRQVIGNLIDNAIKFNLPSGWIKIEQIEIDGRPGVRIADGGHGMTPAQLAAAGDPFLRANPHQARFGGGSGLNLAIGRSLIELHGGELRVDSSPGSGTVVTLVLAAPQPLAAPATPA